MTSEKYDAWHTDLGRREEAQDNNTATGTWYAMVRRRVENLSGLRVVEVGCGRGAFAIELARLGANVTALDFSAAAIEIARSRAAREGVGVDFLVADAQATGLPDKHFDLVVSCECLEHVLDPHAMARELFRICQPGGRCVLTTPSYMNGVILAWVMNWLRGRPHNSGAGVQPHENFFLFFGVRRMLRKAGFQVRDEDSRIFQWLLLPRTDPARLRTVSFRSTILNRLARPVGLHYLFDLKRPD